MCVISMVMDHYRPMFPDVPIGGPLPTSQQFDLSRLFPSAVDLDELRRLINDFKQAVDAAKKVDLLTAQPDCIDPEKAKLLERVERLERVIDALLASKP